MIKKILFTGLLLFIVSSCSIFKKDSFQGLWTLILSGDFSETFDFIVTEDNSFSFTKTIYVQGRDLDASFQGDIFEDGTLTCEVMVMGMKVAEVSGKMNYENGSGIWVGGSMKGEWTAVKK